MAALLFLLSALHPGAAFAAGASLAIVFPPNKALLTGDGALDVLGFQKEGTPAAITVKNKGGKQSYPADTGAFTVRVALAPGENSIELGDRKAVVYLAGAVADAAAAGYTPPDTHAVDNACDDCHAFEAGAISLKEKPPELCAGCHDNVLQGKDGQEYSVLHPPAEDGDCLACHTVHSVQIKKISPAAMGDLCFSCHDDFTGGDRKQLHAPVKSGECTGCHAVHGSQTKKLLHADPARALCLKCHKDPGLTSQGAEWTVPHAALDDGCSGCHQPHFAETAQLLSKPQGELCAGCHEDKNLDGNGNEWASTHQPVRTGRCSACHRPHGSEEKALLPSAPIELCLSCHTTPHERHRRVDINPLTGLPETDKAELPAGFPVRRKDGVLGCVGCHVPHGSDFAALRPQDEMLFCVQCHTKY